MSYFSEQNQHPVKNNITELIIQIDGIDRIDSRIVARELGIQHKNLFEVILKYQEKIGIFGQLPFQTEVVNGHQGGGNPKKYALLNEDQAIFIGTLSRNTDQVITFKTNLVAAFSQVRRAISKSTVEPIITLGDIVRQTERLLTVVKSQDQELQVTRPKAKIHDQIVAHGDLRDFRQVAKVLGWGRNRFMAELRDDGILMSDNIPYQQYIDSGYFIVKEKVIERSNGTFVVRVTYVTGKGVTWLARKYCKEVVKEHLVKFSESA